MDRAPDRGFYIFGIVGADHDPLPEGPSIGDDGAPEIVVLHGLGVVGEWVDLSRPLGRRRHLVAHTEVVNALAAQGPVLPMRFGSVIADEAEALEELVAPRADGYRQMLEEVRGRDQFVVRARYDLDTVLADLVTQDPLIADLRHRTSDLPEDAGQAEKIRLGELVSAAMEQRRAYDSSWLQDQVAPEVEQIAERSVAGMDALAEFAVAVPRDNALRFETVAEGLAEEMHPWGRLSLVGPMALYDFIPEV